MMHERSGNSVREASTTVVMDARRSALLARLRRARPGDDKPARTVWRWLVPVVSLAAGLLFATSHQAAHGTDLRSPQTVDLADTVRTAESQAQATTQQLQAIDARLKAANDAVGKQNTEVGAAQAQGNPLLAPAGLTAVSGPGLMVVLDDANSVPAGLSSTDQNELVVHQSDLQAVVNALWAGGAEAMTVAGQRIIATSAVRCVGNTLLLNGQVFSPPYRVRAIGPAGTMQDSLNRSAGVTLFKQAAKYYGLGYTVESMGGLTLPAYSGPVNLSYAKVSQ
jgi:uncharacterized protein YlxW (UPF0749 family)